MNFKKYLFKFRLTWHKLPKSFRNILFNFGISKIFRRIFLKNELPGVFPLSGRLKGLKIFIQNWDQYQLIDPNFEFKECSVIEKIVEPGWICADVGAHIGYMTLLMAQLSGEKGLVYAFEALPENVQRLQRNIDINKLSNRILVENYAVSDDINQNIMIYVSTNSFEGSVFPDFANHISELPIEIPAISLDKYYSTKVAPQFIKMDIEGGEIFAFKGMKQLLSTSRPILLIEVHNKGREFLEDIISVDYSLFNLLFKKMELSDITPPRCHCIAIPNEKCNKYIEI